MIISEVNAKLPYGDLMSHEPKWTIPKSIDSGNGGFWADELEFNLGDFEVVGAGGFEPPTSRTRTVAPLTLTAVHTDSPFSEPCGQFNESSRVDYGS